MVACALTMTALVVKSYLFDPVPPTASGEFYPQKDWLDYAERGNNLGDSTAPVLFIEFGDFQCPACRVLSERLADLLERRPKDVRILYRHLPLPTHPFARASAIAAECAQRFGRFEEMHDALFGDQKAIGTLAWSQFALKAGIEDTVSYNSCLSDSSVAAAVSADERASARLNISGTPTLLANGSRITGVPFEYTLDSLVDEALKKR